jgi:hypothetical protein
MATDANADPQPSPATGGPLDTAPGVPPTLEATRRVVTVGWLFTALAVLLVPWTTYLFITLPSEARAENYDLAWGGFDVGLVVLLALTGLAAVRHSPWLAAVAGGTATVLVVDAWFDVVMAEGGADRWVAMAMAVAVELPLAVVCGWLAVRGQVLLARQLHWAAWRSARRRRQVAARAAATDHDAAPVRNTPR